MVVIDLEGFGVYQPPAQALSPPAQAFGMQVFGLSHLCDFEIICSDGKRLACSRRLLDERWEWFRERLKKFEDSTHAIVPAQPQQTEDTQADSSSTITPDATAPLTLPPNPTAIRDIRMLPRTLDLPESSTTVTAFLQYLHTLSLCTPLHQSLPVITGLLAFSTTYEEKQLRALCVHWMHEWLDEQGRNANNTGGSAGASGTVAIYEAATLGSCHALQVRALKIMMVRFIPNHYFIAID